MAYDVTKLVKLGALKALAEKVKSDYATKSELTTLSGKVDTLITTGGEPNVIEKIAVNGAEQAISDKKVDIAVPTKVSDLTNDSKFQTDTEVSTAIATAIAEIGHASFKVVDAVPTAAEAEDNVLYLVMNADTEHYDIYAKVGTDVVRLDDTTVDLSAYAKTTDVNTALEEKVDKVEGKGLSTNDYTTEEKTKLAGIAANATKVEASATNGKVKIDGVDTVVYTEPEDVVHGGIATDAEVTEMLNEVFGA